MNLATLSRQLAGLIDPELRARRAAEVLSQLAPEEGVRLLAGLARRAHRRTDPDSAALEGALRACRLHLSLARLEQLRGAAAVASEEELISLLSGARAARAFEEEREAWVDRAMRSRSLGERKQMARGHDRDQLARLATDPEPAVVRALLQNPRVTEREVLIAAARRPARAAVLEEIFVPVRRAAFPVMTRAW